MSKFPTFQTDAKTPEELVLSIFNHIKSIVNRFYPELRLGDNGNEDEFTMVSWEDGFDYYIDQYGDQKFIELSSWVYGYDNDDSNEFFEICGDSFNDYFCYLSKALSEDFNSTVIVKIDTSTDWCFQISVSGF